MAAKQLAGIHHRHHPTLPHTRPARTPSKTDGGSAMSPSIEWLFGHLDSMTSRAYQGGHLELCALVGKHFNAWLNSGAVAYEAFGRL